MHHLAAERKLCAPVQLEQQQKRAEEQGEHPHVLSTHTPVAASPATIDGSRTTAWAVFLLAFSSVFREVTPPACLPRRSLGNLAVVLDCVTNGC